MKWDVGSRRTIYESWFVELHIDQVTLPDGRVVDHEVVSVPGGGASLAAIDPERGILMIYRHRFITDAWGWECPAGRIDDGESPAEAAARECLEETGWRPGPVHAMTAMNPCSGLSDQRYHLFRAESAVYVGEPSDPNEADKIEWRTFEQVRADLSSGAIPDGLAQFGVTLALASVGELRGFPAA